MSEEWSGHHLFEIDTPVFREVGLDSRNRVMAYLGNKRDLIDNVAERNRRELEAAREKAKDARFFWKFFADAEVRSLEISFEPREADKKLREDLRGALMDLTTSPARCDRASRLLGFYIESNLGFAGSYFRAYDGVGRQIAAESEEDAIEAYICLREIDLDKASRYSKRFEKLAKSYDCSTAEELLDKYESARAERLAKTTED